MTLKKTLIALAAGAALVATAAVAQFPGIWTKPAAGFTVIGNIHYVGTEGLSAWLITSPKGHILIDGGMPQNAALVEANIKALGFKLSDVDLILNSHAHFDHAGALAQLKKSTGAVVIASAGDRWALENGKYPGSEEVAAYAFPPVKVDKTVADGEVLTLGGNSLKANLTPGHTKGCTSWTTTVKEGAKAYKVIFWCSTSVAANRLAPNPQYPGIVDDYRRTFVKLGKMEADVFLAPHPEQMGLWSKKAAMGPGKPNPFVDPTELPKVTARMEADFKAQLAKQEAAK
ncbi:MAG TPA: subclass B3 metallo-beta-lactamase [Caulobacter sp.]|nr:subclass B3 metallo-beta-lactamase [Caulobacter sp.]